MIPLKMDIEKEFKRLFFHLNVAIAFSKNFLFSKINYLFNFLRLILIICVFGVFDMLLGER